MAVPTTYLRLDTPLVDAIGERNCSFLAELRSVGYTARTIGLAEIALQIQIAWADGHVTGRERDAILEAARQRGLLPAAYHDLMRRMEHRPSTRFFDVSFEAVRRMLARLPCHARERVRVSLLRECAMVAGASGGFLAWGSVSAAERRVIEFFDAGLRR